MSKILIWSDLHLHNWTYGADYSMGWNSRLLGQLGLMSEIAQAAVQHGADTTFFCGDMFHTHGKIDSAVMSVAIEGVKLLSQEVENNYFLVGNHDLSTKSSFMPYRPNSLEAIGEIADNVEVINTVRGNVKEKDFTWSAVPFIEDGKVLERTLIDHVARGVSGHHLLFMHQGVAGVPVGSGYLIDETFKPEMVPDNVDICFIGHYHPHRKVTDKLVMVGSPMQLNWSDKNESRGYIIYDTDSRSWTFHELNAPKFIEMDASFAETAIKLNFDDFLDTIQNNYVRVINVPDNWLTDRIKKHLATRAASLELLPKDEDIKLESSDPLKEFDVDVLVTEFSKKFSKRHIQVDQQLRADEYAYEPNLPRT